jgi:hypothetical protein
MKRQHTTLTVLLLLGCCVCSYAAADDRLHPQTKFASHGISLLSPDEDGWVVFNPTGKDPTLAKYGATRIETYSIQISYSKSPSSARACERDFAGIAKRINTTVSDRFKVRVNRADLDLSRGPYFVNYYVLAEDYGAHGKPSTQQYALFEQMGFFACDPNDPDRLVRVEYSYRYYPGHEDPEFKAKAKWVLDRATFTTQ